MRNGIYLNIFLRNIGRNKLYFTINLIGLIIGITTSLFIFLYVSYEFSYDRFHNNGENIYRIAVNNYQEGKLSSADAMAYSGLAPALKADIPAIKDYVRLKGENGFIGREDKKDTRFKEFKIFYADPHFFDFFSFPLINGDKQTALKEPNTAVITAAAQKKYFGNESALGKTIIFDGKEVFNITGIMADLPENSHLRLEFLFSYSTLYHITGRDSAENSLDWNEFYTYIRLDPDAKAGSVEHKINTIATAIKGERLAKAGRKETLFLQPLRSIHTASDLLHEIKPATSDKTLYFFLLAGVIILLIAWINYVNLTTIKAFERAKEVGIQKVLGAERGELMKRFLLENTITNLAAVIIAIVFLLVLPPLLFNYLNTQLFAEAPLRHTGTWVIIGAIFLCGVFITGIYPATLMSSFMPVSILKGKFKRSPRDIFLREALVAFQFLITMMLIGVTLVIYRQINFMLSMNKGINIERMLAIESPRVFSNDTIPYKLLFEGFKHDLSRNKNITNVSFTTTVSSKENYWKEPVRLSNEEVFKSREIEVAGVDQDFMKTFQIQLKAGRFYADEFPADGGRSIILNEAAVRYLGMDNADDALKKKLVLWDNERDIVGVIKNYYNLSLKRDISPTAYVFRYVPRSYVTVKIDNADNFSDVIKYCRAEWDNFFPGNSFEYFIVQESYDKQYQDEIRFKKIFILSTILASLIACLGLFGLTLYETIQRKREIGIRKSLGATTFDIVKLLSLKVVKILAIVIVIAIPIIHISMSKWLSGYTVHITLSVWIYLLTIVLITLITLFTTVYQSIKAANNTPIQSLRNE
ncbi:ABC transporter permease [Chitinophaga sp.]|uniref:ABC transporter permease n=1 Tax=Chitinophaga sp. TaxID=1869181 RepID=UPI0031CE27E7